MVFLSFFARMASVLAMGWWPLTFNSFMTSDGKAVAAVLIALIICVCIACIARQFFVFWKKIKEEQQNKEKDEAVRRENAQEIESWRKMYAELMAKWLEFEKEVAKSEKKMDAENYRNTAKTIAEDLRHKLVIPSPEPKQNPSTGGN